MVRSPWSPHLVGDRPRLGPDLSYSRGGPGPLADRLGCLEGKVYTAVWDENRVDYTQDTLGEPKPKIGEGGGRLGEDS